METVECDKDITINVVLYLLSPASNFDFMLALSSVVRVGLFLVDMWTSMDTDC